MPCIALDASFLSLSINNIVYRFHAVWLRDNALDEQTRSQINGQRLITLLEQPADIKIDSASLENQELLVRFVGDSQNYRYPLAWLLEHHYDCSDNNARSKGWLTSSIKTWGREQQTRIVKVSFNELLRCDEVLYGWLSAIERYGFGIVNHLDDDPDSLFKVVARFGFIRETNYGRAFEVKAQINPSNLAYTGLGLQAHTDNPYRDPTPTLQILSCIENTTEGGESILVDGFNAAKILQQESPEHFELLSRYCANFRYAGDANCDLQSTRPMIECAPDGQLIAVRFNNRSAAPFTRIPFAKMAAYYQAYRHFAEIIERKDGELQFKLNQGELFIVNNQRIMHSRKGFSAGGQRHLRGAYADVDGLRSTLAVLDKQYGVKNGNR